MGFRNIGLLAVPLALAACSGGDGGNESGQQPGGGAAPPPARVGVVTVQPQTVTLTTELPGRLSAFETSEVRPQVNGLVLDRLFTEGEQVSRGQALYRIDPQPYQAAAASARANLARSRAAIASSAALARRYGELVRINAISRQDFENAQTSAAQARADVSAQQAALRSAQIDLGRTTIRAPIAGRIGRSTFTTGALVTAAQAEPLTTIQRLDPIYVDITQSSADLLRLRQQLLGGQVSRGQGATRVRLRLEDGSVYPVEGTLQFTDVSVDPTTGSQTIRARFPNPNRLLLPGMYARAELIQGTQANALLVPQRAVTRDERGQATAMVVGPDNKVAARQLQTTRTIGENWLVTGGLRAGDRVVVEGGMMLRPGMPVQAYPYRAGAPAGGAGAQPGAQAGQPAGQAQGKAK
jgi:membrane fusion protein, multidrug efflux system